MTKCLFRTSLVWLLATGCSITVLLLPAIWNGFPLVFADTGGYLERPFQGDLEIGRSALYGAFLAAGIPLQFWPNVLIQAGVTLWILRLVLRIHRAGDRPSVFIAVIIGLCLLTSLPWYVSQLMPDIFLPLAMLAAYILAFAPGELRQIEKTALVLFIGIAIAFHMSILALVVALLVIIALLNQFGHWLRLPTPAIGLPSAGLIAGLMLAPISNLVITGSLGFTPGGTTFVFARLVQDGIVRQYLADHCPDDHLRLCAYRKQLPTSADDWLWSYSSPLHKLGWWRAFEPEANRIIRESLAYYPRPAPQHCIGRNGPAVRILQDRGRHGFQRQLARQISLCDCGPKSTGRVPRLTSAARRIRFHFGEHGSNSYCMALNHDAHPGLAGRASPGTVRGRAGNSVFNRAGGQCGDLRHVLQSERSVPEPTRVARGVRHLGRSV